MREDPLSQEVLNAINVNLARALEAGDRPENQPVFAVHREIFPNSRMVDHLVDGAVHVSVHNADSGRRLALGALVSARRVGRLDVRLVRVLDADAQGDAWSVVVASPRGEVARGHRKPSPGVVVLTYSSGSARARDVAARYAEEATEVDLTSDFDPAAHYFGERRVARRS